MLNGGLCQKEQIRQPSKQKDKQSKQIVSVFPISLLAHVSEKNITHYLSINRMQ